MLLRDDDCDANTMRSGSGLDIDFGLILTSSSCVDLHVHMDKI